MTRDYINNYVCNRLMHVCMYQVIELYDYYCVVRDPRYTVTNQADKFAGLESFVRRCMHVNDKIESVAS